jgi:hypothetical protein
MGHVAAQRHHGDSLADKRLDMWRQHRGIERVYAHGLHAPIGEFVKDLLLTLRGRRVRGTHKDFQSATASGDLLGRGRNDGPRWMVLSHSDNGDARERPLLSR